MYHVTERQWPEEIELKPMRTSDIPGCGRDEEEPDTARICVAPTIAGCFTAICQNLCHCGDTYYIYRTRKKFLGCKARQVIDAHITGERWLLWPATFVRVGEVGPSYFAELGDAIDADKKVPYVTAGNPDHLGAQERVHDHIQRVMAPIIEEIETAEV